MSVDREEILRIASLARLRLDEGDLERMTRELNTILGHVDALAELDGLPAPAASSGVEPLRSTRAAEGTGGRKPVEDPGALAPAWKDGFFLVPPPPGIHADGGAE